MDAHGRIKKLEEKDRAYLKHSGDFGPAHFTHFIREPEAHETFQIDENYIAERAKLAKVIANSKRNNIVLDGSGEIQEWENSNIPSGYTYLLQLVAHDMVFSALTDSSEESGPDDFLNRRVEALNLDTLYKIDSETECPPYLRDKNTDIPRNKFALGRIQFSEGYKTSPECPYKPPFRDIARTRPNGAEHLSLPCLADVRNDNNSVLSQLNTLFFYLHNGIVKHLESKSDASDNSLTSKAFLHARQVVTSVYLDIIEYDLLKRILSSHVYEHYRSSGVQFLHPSNKQIPIEFSHAAFRFGHSMIRPNYFMGQRFKTSHLQHAVLSFNSSGSASEMPFNERWIIDWSDYFEMGIQRPRNLSGKIEPFYSSGITSVFNPGHGTGGLAGADLKRASEAGLWSTNSLLEVLSEAKPDLFAASKFYNNGPLGYKRKLIDWLVLNAGHGRPNISIDPNGPLAQNPPLSFYCLFEASEENNGTQLGTMGSIIVADIIFSTIHERRSHLDLKAIKKTMKRIFEARKIKSMPSLIEKTQPFFGRNDCELPVFKKNHTV